MADKVKISTQIMDAIISIDLPPELANWMAQITPETIEYAVLHYGLPAVLALFFGRTVSTIILRAIGLSHPNHYRFWPRLILWRKPFKVWMWLSHWYEKIRHHGKQATGGFASVFSMLTLMYTPKTFFIGRAYGWGVGLLQPIGIPVTRHIMVFAMTGAGKTTFLVTALSCWRGSASVVDPKGQISETMARNDYRDWIIFRPYDPNNTAFINVFDDIKAAPKREGQGAEIKWAVRVGEALIVTPENSKNKYFTDSARSFLVSLILHVLTFHD